MQVGGFNNETIFKWGPGSPDPAGIQLYNGGGVIGPPDTPAMTDGWHHYVFVSDGATDDLRQLRRRRLLGQRNIGCRPWSASGSGPETGQLDRWPEPPRRSMGSSTNWRFMT